MNRKSCYTIIFSCVTISLAKEPELPLCPTNVQYLPQNIPMHCRLPPSNSQAAPPYFAPPMSGKPAANSQIIPVPPIGFPPGAPPGMPLGAPHGFPAGPLGFPGFAPGAPMPPGVPMPMPMPGAPPSAKLPVIVMPYYSPDPAYKGPHQHLHPDRTRRPRGHRNHPPKRYRDTSSDTSSGDTDTDTSSDTSRESSDGGWWKARRSMTRQTKKRRHHKKKEELLTPILQYVTKDGYVIYEKQISKGEAKDWMGDTKPKNEENVEKPQPETVKDKSEVDEEVEIITTKATQTTPKIRMKVQKNTNIIRHHHLKPNHLAKQNQHNLKQNSHLNRDI